MERKGEDGEEGYRGGDGEEGEGTRVGGKRRGSRLR